MTTLLGDWKRSQMCTELDKRNVSNQVTLMGWVQRKRNLGSLIFVWLRDRTGIVQIVFDSSKQKELFEQAECLRSEFVISVKGEVALRTKENINPQLATGEIEVIVKELKILSESELLPFAVEDAMIASDALRYKYRYLDLRRPDMQKNIMLRHRIAKCARDYLDNNGFLEIETPMLTKSTPEGARDYLVPSRVHPGKFFALPQSPQLFKQLLMLSGYDKYFQIVRCFRDEDLRADRQPEFTQIDIEMSFVDVNDIIEVNEGLIAAMMKEGLGLEIQLPIPRITYQQAMDKYGSDKPDVRFGLEMQNISDLVENCGFKVFSDTVAAGGSVRALNAKGSAEKLSRRDIDALTEVVKLYKAKGLAWAIISDEGVKSSLQKFFSEDEMNAIVSRLGGEKGDILFFVADKHEIACTALGQLRLELGRRLSLIPKDEYRFVWVTEFPLLEYNEDAKRYVAMHHPFTSPMDEDIALLESNPAKVRAKAYDIVLNGTELGGGSIRIHSSALQEKMFEVLGFSKEEAWNRFGFLLEAFKFGPPPHGGIAYGLDRIIMLMAGCDSIRDVIAFPKMQNAACLLADAPSYVDEAQLKELSIAITNNAAK